MQLQDALRDAPSFLRNAQDVATRSPANPDTLYMWDNQVIAIEGFLANTEDLNGQNPDLQRVRKELFDLKKQIQSKVLEFELKAENQELPPDPTEEEVVKEMLEFGKEVRQLCRELSQAQIRTVKELDELEEPRQVLNSFIVDTEPLQGKNIALDKQREAAKKTRAQLEQRISEIIKEWRQADLAGGDDDDDG
jgi:hypothetical protein